MSTDKNLPNKNNNRRKRNNDVTVKEVEPATLEFLSNTYIHLVQKPSSKFPKARFICKICPYHMDDTERAVKHSGDIIHKKNLQRTSTRNLMKYLPNPTSNQLEAVEKCLKETLEQDIFISETEANRRRAICKDMSEIAFKIDGRLTICGSLAIGLSIANVSDVNLYADFSSAKITSYLMKLQQLSQALNSELRLKTDIKQDKNNCGLFVEDSQGVSYHISASTRVCQLTSAMLAVYLQIDERAECLVKLFRHYAHKAFIDRFCDGLFAPQVFSILVVYYLQQLAIPILPNLHKLADSHPDLPVELVTSAVVYDSTVRYVSDVDTIRKLWTPPTNNLSLAQMWIGLLRFYTIDFDSNLYMVSIRCSEPVIKEDRNIVNKRLAVEDPFDFKRNLLFSWNTPDVIDFFNDQLQGCYIYFAVPQLITGPAFNKVNFLEITMETMGTNCLVTPTFTKDNFSVTIDLMETEFKEVYKEQSSLYDLTKWPVRLFVKICLSRILTSIFDSSHEIDCFIWLLDFKGSSYFSVTNYSNFKEHAMKLAMCIFHDFSAYFEANNAWAKPDINCKEAYHVIKKSAQKFINESLNITMNDDENEDDDFEMHDMDNNDMEVEENMEDLGMTMEDGNDEPDTTKPNKEHYKVEKVDTVERVSADHWKKPISCKLIYLPIKGVLDSSNEADLYNKHRVQSIQKEQLEYSFLKMSVHKNKLEISCTLCNAKGHRKEYCPDAIPRFEENKNIMRDVDPDWLSKLDGVLNRKFENTRPSKERLATHEKIFQEINKIIKNLYPNVRPQMFGSMHNGFMTRASDIDICLEFYADNERQHLSNKEITTRLRSIGRDLKKNYAGVDVAYILRAKVPIIKFYIKDNIQGDISINNSLAIQNTKMLKLYADINPRLKNLGNLLKFVSKSCDIGDASQGTLSSYAYIILLVHFLQKRDLLPVLQELHDDTARPTVIIDGWDAWYQSNLGLIYKLWKSKSSVVSLAHMWLDFFHYYTVEFKMDTEVVSVRQAAPMYKIDKGWQMSYMAIEDPFDLNHNLSGSLSLDKCRYILQCFAHVLRLHGNNDNIQRNDNALNLLMEPTTLRPACNNPGIRTCFQCNKQGHVARDCNEKQQHRTPTKNGVTIKQALPSIATPFLLKTSTTPNRLYLQTDQSQCAPNFSIPMKSFSGAINDFSVVPISLTFGNKSIVVPMLLDKDGKIHDKLNDMLDSGLQSVCALPIEVMGKLPEVVESSIAANTGGNNFKKPLPKRPTPPHPNSRPQNEYFNSQFANRYPTNANQNFNPNPVRLLATTNHNQGNRYQEYNIPPGYAYGPMQGNQRFYQDFQQMNLRHMNPNNNNNNMRYPKGNK